MTKKKKRVLLGMSGGVDSSVCALLLKKRGYDVIGITLQLLPKDNEKQSACCNLNSINDAKRVAARLNIPHYTLNIRDNFKKRVIDYFVDSYLQGDTPNPCVECNRYIKFDELKKKADELGAEYIATGHYCKRTVSKDGKLFNLKKAKDPRKDQTYFLYMVDSPQLEYTLFPLGGYTKAEIREIAEKNNLINAKKPDSQEICFVTQGNYKNFIQSQIEDRQVKHGDIVNTKGEVLGQHTGLYQYTIGQRKGLGIASQEPLYVIDVNVIKNHVIVGGKDDLLHHTMKIETLSLVNPNEDILGKTFDIKTRYQMTPFRGRVVEQNNDCVTVKMTVPQGQLSPGQSAVFYKQDRVVGGGIIVR